MANPNIRKFLKLFCIAESGNVRIEPSCKSWFVFCIFLLASILVLLSGVHFQRSHINETAVFCFAISGVGFGITLVTLLAILLGCNIRRRHRVSNRNHVGGTYGGRPERRAISEESVWIGIEKDAITYFQNTESNRQWMNPVYGDCDNPLYETEVEQFECYEEVYSNDSRNSVKNVPACSYNSSPEDYDFYRTKLEESDLNEADGHCFRNYQDCGGMVEDKSHGRVEALKMVSNHAASADNLNASMSHQEPKLDRFQVYLHNKMTSCLPENRNLQQSSWNSMEGEMLLNGKSSPMETESGFYENTVCLDSSFHSNYEKPYGIYLNLEECDGMQEYSAEYRNAHVNLDLGSLKHTTVADLKHESHANTEYPNELEQNASFSVRKPCEEYQNNNKYSKLKQVDKFAATTKNIDIQTSEESNNCNSLSKPVSYQNVKTALMAHVRNLADKKYSQSLEQCPHKRCGRYCNAHEISKSPRNSYSRSAMEHCDGAGSTRPMTGFESNSSIDRRHRKVQYQSRRETPSREDFENGLVPFRHPIPKTSEASANSDRRRWKENIRIRKRPLLDVNGEPISQSEYVKVLSKLLKNELQSSQHPIYARPYNYITSNLE